MQKETQLRDLSDRLLKSTLATLPQRPLPPTAHQAVAALYDALDRYTDAVHSNNLAAAKRAAEKLSVETLRVLMGYEIPQAPAGIDRVRVENSGSVNQHQKA